MFLEVRGSIFVQGTIVDVRFMMFTEVLMKELARIWIHVHKIFNRRMSFKML